MERASPAVCILGREQSFKPHTDSEYTDFIIDKMFVIMNTDQQLDYIELETLQSDKTNQKNENTFSNINLLANNQC